MEMSERVSSGGVVIGIGEFGLLVGNSEEG
jgi:hypothetical protein